MSVSAIAMKNLYLAGKITRQNLEAAEEKGFITSDELKKILALKPED